MKWKVSFGFIVFTIIFLLASSSVLTPVIAANPLYNWDVQKITDDGEPKFFMNVAARSNGAVLTYLTNTTYLNFSDPDIIGRSNTVVTTIEQYSTETSAHPTIRFDYKLAPLNEENNLIVQPITLAHNVLGYKYPVIIDSQNRVHTLYITSLANQTHPYNPIKNVTQTFLYYVRFDHLFDPSPSLVPDEVRLLNNPKIDIVADPIMVLDPDEQNLYVSWSSRLNVPKYSSTSSGGITTFDYAYTITYLRYNIPSNTTTTWRVANDARTPAYIPPSDMNYRRPGLFLKDDTMYMVYNEFPQKAAETFIKFIEFPKNPTNLNWTYGDPSHTKGFGNGTSITRLTGGFYTRTPEIFEFGNYLWVGWVVELQAKDVPSVAYKPLNSDASWLVNRFDQKSRDMLSISYAKSPDGSRAHLIWSLENKPENPRLKWSYDAFLATISKGFDDPKLAWQINRISLVPETAHTFPVVTYIGNNLETFWIQITKTNIYDVYVAHEPIIPNFGEQSFNAFIITLLIGTILTVGISIYMMKYIKTEKVERKIGRIDLTEKTEITNEPVKAE